jgi:serine/threonine protein phosphatase 1
MLFLISDIHGCFYTLQKLIDKVLVLDRTAEFVFLGDYVDRGLHSKLVIDYLLELQKNHSAVFLRGNHDDVHDWLLNNQCMSHDDWTHKDFAYVWDWWLYNGLISSVKSYGVDQQDCQKWVDVVPESHKKFFRDLNLYWENSTHFACHGYMRPFEELPRILKFISQDRNDEALWSRFRDLNTIKTKWDKIGVFGHTPTLQFNSPVPIRVDKLRLIDTGSFMNNYLTAYVCEQDDWISQATDSRDLHSF